VGLTVVLENGCDAPITFTIDGDEVVSFVEGDEHDTKCEFDVGLL
jgi:hypothetical protein